METAAVPPGSLLEPGGRWRAERAAIAEADGAQWRARLERAWRQFGYAVAVYLVSRGLLLAVAAVDTGLQHSTIQNELTNWDGFWYVTLAALGYPTHDAHLQSTLGFFPLYPGLTWVVGYVLGTTKTIAALVVAGGGGGIATVLVERLCRRWWGDAAARRAVVLFCCFPGSVVFSMAYSEGVLIPLAAGCLLALERRRWVLAGVCAGLATAVGPDALAIIPACAVAFLLELRRRGSHDRAAGAARDRAAGAARDRAAWRSIAAPLLAPAGIVGFGVFLWTWVGTPFAAFRAQRYGWGERTDLLALLHQAQGLAGEISFTHFDAGGVDLNIVAGLLGAVLGAYGLYLLCRRANRIPGPALVWTLGIGFLAATSEYTPPNPRLLITAFPAVVVLAQRFPGKRAFGAIVAVSTVLLVVTSAITYVGIALRP